MLRAIGSSEVALCGGFPDVRGVDRQVDDPLRLSSANGLQRLHNTPI